MRQCHTWVLPTFPSIKQITLTLTEERTLKRDPLAVIRKGKHCRGAGEAQVLETRVGKGVLSHCVWYTRLQPAAGDSLQPDAADWASQVRALLLHLRPRTTKPSARSFLYPGPSDLPTSTGGRQFSKTTAGISQPSLAMRPSALTQPALQPILGQTLTPPPLQGHSKHTSLPQEQNCKSREDVLCRLRAMAALRSSPPLEM